MMDISHQILQLAFDLKPGEPLTEEQRTICEEWTSGKALEYMQIDIDDPRVLENLAIYRKWEKRKDAVWKEMEDKRSK